MAKPLKRFRNRLVGRLLVTLGRTIGLTVCKPERLEQTAFAHHMARLFSRYQITSVIDVGANTGGFGVFLRRHVGFSGPIVSFEPVSQNFAELRARSSECSNRNWTSFKLALGASDTQTTINVMKSNVFSSFLSPDASHVPDFADQNALSYTETVDVRRLDAIWPTHITPYLQPNLYLKLDTQGFDLAVLQGAQARLGEIAGLQLEVSVLPLYRDMPSMVSILTTLESQGFDLTAVCPVVRDHALRIVEFDAVFLNRSYIS